MKNLFEEFDGLLNDTFGKGGFLRTYPLQFENFYYRSKTDETEDLYILELALPGFDKKDVSIDLVGDTLTVSFDGEETPWKKKFKKGFRLPELVDDEDISAKFENGILKVEILKSKREKTKRISIR